MKRKEVTARFSVLFFLLAFTIILPTTPVFADNSVSLDTIGNVPGSRMVFGFTYNIGTDPADIQYVLDQFTTNSPVPVQLPEDIDSVYATGILVASVDYRALKPVTSEFIQFMAGVDESIGKSNVYDWILLLIQWLEKFIPAPPPTDTEVPADFAGVVWLHANVSGWSQTGTLSSVTLTDTTITLDYNKANVWPGVYIDGAYMNANLWVFVNLDGTWYAATWEWMKVGQITKNLYAVNGDHIKVPPLDTWSPVSGERYGFMVSGLARSSQRNVYERTNVVMLTWP